MVNILIKNRVSPWWQCACGNGIKQNRFHSPLIGYFSYEQWQANIHSATCQTSKYATNIQIHRILSEQYQQPKQLEAFKIMGIIKIITIIIRCIKFVKRAWHDTNKKRLFYESKEHIRDINILVVNYGKN